jgi:hypothetical protein
MSVRIKAADLRDAARQAAAVRANAAARGEEAPEILLDVEVTIDISAATAFSSVEDIGKQPGSPIMRYIGTPRGLAGLISDVRRLDIADGVVLLTPAKDNVVQLMLDELAPGLGTPRRIAG